MVDILEQKDVLKLPVSALSPETRTQLLHDINRLVQGLPRGEVDKPKRHSKIVIHIADHVYTVIGFDLYKDYQIRQAIKVIIQKIYDDLVADAE